MKRDPLELYVEAELGELLNLRFTAGSGNALGDADLKPKNLSLSDLQFGIECKRTTRSNNHLVNWDDYQKAKKQIERGGFIPVMVTQNKANHRMAHLSLDDFKNLLEIVKEAHDLILNKE
ncbi:hypothetical protein [Acinetobacter sp.]|uniref:hypothetical protein n=1 Tax=Acinetobacter sp. TaxID=472 RepID=UPI003D081A6D